MPKSTIPQRLPATANDVSTHVARLFGQHMELGCRLTFDRHLDPDVLSRAVRLSLDAEPVFGCALRTGVFRAWWERLSDLDARVPFSIIPTGDPDRDAIAAQTRAIESGGPQVAVCLVRSEGVDDLVITVSHDAADGQGLKQYAYGLADIYSHLLGDPSYAPAPHPAARPAAADVWDALSPEQRRRANRTPAMTMPNWKVTCKGATGAGRTLSELRLEPDRFRRVKEYGSARGATVNALLLTAFFRAIAQEFSPPAGKAMSLPFSVDYRRYLQASDDIPVANLAVSIWLGVPSVEGETFEATLDRVGEQLREWRDALWGAKGLMQATSAARLGYGPMRLMMGAISKAAARSDATSPVFTNIGVIDEAKLAFGEAVPVSARLSGPAAFGASLVPTISTYKDELTVSMGFCESDMDADVIERVLGNLDAELSLD